ncbi:MAG TPA: DUF47 family protein [Candidatus Aphodovivens avistercoris]|nr:DUF47 family protein [Candidatus Aphodovivens avistercoris]
MGKKSRKFDYFEQFEKQVEVAIEEADLLVEAVEGFTNADALKPYMDRAHQIERRGDDVNHAILQNVATDFITPIEREDIIDLAQKLDTIIDYIEDVIQSMYMYDVHIVPEGAPEFARLIRKGVGALGKAMGDFSSFKKSKKFRALVRDVSDYEEEADRLVLKVIRHLHTTDRDNPMRAHVWSRVFERMEKCSDACEHAADTMNSIMLKNV